MGGEIERILERAAKDPAFLRLLIDNRDKTLESLGASESVKEVLRAADADQLRKMIDNIPEELAKPKKRWGKPGIIALTGVATAIAISAPNLISSRGISVETAQETMAENMLLQIAVGQVQYRRSHGRYATLEELIDAKAIPKSWLDRSYKFELEIDGDTFKATAVHRTRPDTRKAFIVGPDIEIRELKVDDRP